MTTLQTKAITTPDKEQGKSTYNNLLFTDTGYEFQWDTSLLTVKE